MTPDGEASTAVVEEPMFEMHPDVVKGAWHHLCVGVLLQAVQRVAAETNLFHSRRHTMQVDYGGGVCKERQYQKMQAREWLMGGIGLITYEDCCEAMGVDPARAREKILAWCRSKKRDRLPPPSFYGGGDGQEEE